MNAPPAQPAPPLADEDVLVQQFQRISEFTGPRQFQFGTLNRRWRRRAARHGHRYNDQAAIVSSVALIEEARAAGRSFTESDLLYAAMQSSVDMMLKMYEWGVRIGPDARYNLDIVRVAALGQIQVVEAMYKCHQQPTTGSADFIQQVVRGAARGGHIHLMEYLQVRFALNPNPVSEQLYMSAAAEGRVAFLQWALAHEFPWYFGTYMVAARTGQVAVLQFIQDHGLQLSLPVTLDYGLQHGYIPVVEWAVQQGGQVTEDAWQRVININARAGIDMLDWLHQHNVPMYQFALESAVFNRLWDAARWLVQHGAPDPTHAAAQIPEEEVLDL